MFDGPSESPGEFYRAVMALIWCVVALEVVAFPVLIAAKIVSVLA